MGLVAMVVNCMCEGDVHVHLSLVAWLTFHTATPRRSSCLCQAGLTGLRRREPRRHPRLPRLRRSRPKRILSFFGRRRMARGGSQSVWTLC